MANMMKVDLFAEDRAHESFLDALLRRLIKEGGTEVLIRHRSPLGGHGRMLAELDVFQKIIRCGQPGIEVPDILIVAGMQIASVLLRLARRFLALLIQEYFRRLRLLVLIHISNGGSLPTRLLSMKLSVPSRNQAGKNVNGTSTNANLPRRSVKAGIHQLWAG